MNGNRIFVGDIKKCNYSETSDHRPLAKYYTDPDTGYLEVRPDDIVKKGATLIKVGNDCYVDVDSVTGTIDMLITALRNPLKSSDSATFGCNYVDTDSLRPYFEVENQKVNIREFVKTKSPYKK